MDIRSAYGKFSIPENLQKHMLRVAALSDIFSEKWKSGTLDRRSIVLACAFHDMANIIKFKLDGPPLFKEDEDKMELLRTIQLSTIKKYGTDIHKATLQICAEAGLPEKARQLVEKLEWDNTVALLENHDFEAALCVYCDMRIGPFGIMPFSDRLANLRSRNNGRVNFEATNGHLLENTLQNHITIDVGSVTDKDLEARFEKILNLGMAK